MRGNTAWLNYVPCLLYCDGSLHGDNAVVSAAFMVKRSMGVHLVSSWSPTSVHTCAVHAAWCGCDIVNNCFLATAVPLLEVHWAPQTQFVCGGRHRVPFLHVDVLPVPVRTVVL
jgi:hypothetical protein